MKPRSLDCGAFLLLFLFVLIKMDFMEKGKPKKRYILLIVLLLIQTGLLFVIFGKFKQGFHSDEVFNYGFANSVEYKELDEANDGTSMVYVWQDGQRFRDYITVNEGQQFRYDATLRNANNDLNPPLQILLLHTICSFFPGRFSWYFCLAINLIAFLVTQIYLFRLVKRITGSDFAAFAAVILYGFGIGAMNIAIYQRLYALGVMFVMMFAFYSHRIYESRKETKLPVKELILLFFSCLCGAYTLHLFLAIAFVITLCYVIYYLFSKHLKLFFAHGLAALAAVGVTLILDPQTIAHFGGVNPNEQSYAEVTYPFGMQFRQYLYMLTKDIFGPHVLSYANVVLEVVAVFLGAIILFSIPIIWLFHKDPKFKAFLSGTKEKWKRIWAKRKGFQFTTAVLFISILVTLLFVSWRSSVFFMGKYASRYVFVTYPLAAVWIACILYYLVGLIGEKKKVTDIVILILCVIMTVWTHFNPDADAYFFRHEEEGITFTQIEPGANTVIVMSESWLIVCFAPELYDVGQYYATDFFNFKNDEAVFEETDKTAPCYLLADQKYILPEGTTYEDAENTLLYQVYKDFIYTEEDFLAFYRNMEEVDDVTYVGKDSAFGREYKIYRVKFAE